jgi:hypothetical protein
MDKDVRRRRGLILFVLEIVTDRQILNVLEEKIWEVVSSNNTSRGKHVRDPLHYRLGLDFFIFSIMRLELAELYIG